MTFLTTLGVTEILCSFRLVLESKTGKEIAQSSRLEFLENLLTKLFCFIRYRRQHFRAVEQRWYSRFTYVENTINNSPKVSRAKFLGSNRLFCFISICKFGSFKNPFATITSLPELSFRLRRFILLVQSKKVIFMRLDLILTMRDINSNLNPLTKSTSSSRSAELKDIFPLNISKTTKTVPISTRIVKSYTIKRGALF